MARYLLFLVLALFSADVLADWTYGGYSRSAGGSRSAAMSNTAATVTEKNQDVINAFDPPYYVAYSQHSGPNGFGTYYVTGKFYWCKGGCTTEDITAKIDAGLKLYNYSYTDQQCDSLYSATYSMPVGSVDENVISLGSCQIEATGVSVVTGNEVDGYNYHADWLATSTGEEVYAGASVGGPSDEQESDYPDYMVEDEACTNDCVTFGGNTYRVDQGAIPEQSTLMLQNDDGTSTEYTNTTTTHYDADGNEYDPSDTGGGDGGSDGGTGGGDDGSGGGTGTGDGSDGGGSIGGGDGGSGGDGTGDGDGEESGAGSWSGSGDGYDGFGGEDEHDQALADAKQSFETALEDIRADISGRFSSVSASGTCSSNEQTVWHDTTVDLSACGFLDQMLPVIRPAVLFGCSVIAAFILFGRRNG